MQTHTLENGQKCEAMSQCWESHSRAHDTNAWHFHNEEILNRHWCNRIICIYIPLKRAIATPSKIGQSWLQKAESFMFFYDTPKPLSSQLIVNLIKVIAYLLCILIMWYKHSLVTSMQSKTHDRKGKLACR